MNWKKVKISNIADIKIGLTYKPENISSTGIFVIRSSNIQKGSLVNNDDDVFVNVDKIKNLEVIKDDIIMCARNGSKALIGKSAIINNNLSETTFGAFMLRIRSGMNKYLYQYFQSDEFFKYLNRDMGATINQVTTSYLGNLELLLPPPVEQEKIVQVLSTWDEAINKVLINIDNERRKKKSITSKVYRGQILTNEYNKDYFKRLRSFLSEVSIRNNGAIDNVLSVSNSRGFIPQVDQFDREVASKDRSNYKVVSQGEFAYNPSRVNVGSIDLLTTHESGILSPMYVVFKCNSELNNRYLYHFLKSDLFLQLIPRFTQGSVRDSLSFDGLCSMKLYIPTTREQLIYAKALDTIDEHINKLERLLELYRLQKKGLIQQLLTGKVRVNVN
jgi:type I restriction enzyme S subunit